LKVLDLMAKQQLHLGAKWLFRFRTFFMLLFFSLFLSIWGLAGALFLGIGFGGAFIFWIIFIIVFTEVWARLTYNNYSFELRDEGVYVERGVIIKRYSTVPYQRIQNVDIHRGILARMIGFSTLNIQTAGYAHPRGAGAEGHLPAIGIEEAEKIRKQILSKSGKGSAV
tara:strand:+ start:1357 stop:1860 length:504 start_codon:yes stop_codon:yes gene_type:complete